MLKVTISQVNNLILSNLAYYYPQFYKIQREIQMCDESFEDPISELYHRFANKCSDDIKKLLNHK